MEERQTKRCPHRRLVRVFVHRRQGGRGLQQTCWVAVVSWGDVSGVGGSGDGDGCLPHVCECVKVGECRRAAPEKARNAKTRPRGRRDATLIDSAKPEVGI